MPKPGDVWTLEADKFLKEMIQLHPDKSHMDLARMIINHPLIQGRTLAAVEQRINVMRLGRL